MAFNAEWFSSTVSLALDARFHGAIQLPVDSTRPSSNHVDEDINANYTHRELGLPTKEHREMVRVFDSENEGR